MFRGQVPGPDGKINLPPSCVDDGYSGECEVHYHLTAKIPRTFMDWEDKVTLNFSPWRRGVDVPEQRKEAKQYEAYHRHYRLSKEEVPKALTKREVFKDGFKKNTETKTVNFNLSATAPTQIILGKAYPVEITLTSKDAEELGVLPEFKIKSYELLLKDRTDIRVPGAFTDHYSSLDGHIPLSSSLRLDVVLPANETQTFNGMFPTRGPHPPPTFSSWCVRRTYGLELKATVECLDEEERFKIHWMSVQVLPARMEAGVEEAMRSVEDGTAGMAVGETVEEGDVLPTYEGADQDALPRYEKHVDSNVLGL